MQRIPLFVLTHRVNAAGYTLQRILIRRNQGGVAPGSLLGHKAIVVSWAEGKISSGVIVFGIAAVCANSSGSLLHRIAIFRIVIGFIV